MIITMIVVKMKVLKILTMVIIIIKRTRASAIISIIVMVTIIARLKCLFTCSVLIVFH